MFKIKKGVLLSIFLVIVMSIFSGCSEVTSSDPYISLVQENIYYEVDNDKVSVNKLFKTIADDVEWTTENFNGGMLVSAKLTINNNFISFCYRVDDESKDIFLVGVEFNDTYYSDDYNINGALNGAIREYAATVNNN